MEPIVVYKMYVGDREVKSFKVINTHLNFTPTKNNINLDFEFEGLEIQKLIKEWEKENGLS